ncbi:MAG: hypothetical protein SGILL_002075 [Bacillariaceae sp.]
MAKHSNTGRNRAAVAATLHHDIYSYSPIYEWTSYKTFTGMVLSWISIFFILFYIVLTLREYIVRPPELVSQGDIDLLQTPEEFHFAIPKIGMRLEYTNSSEPDEGRQTVALSNDNPFVELRFHHVVMRDQVRVKETELDTRDCEVSLIQSICPVVSSTQKLQGVAMKSEFEFLEISVDKCNPSNGRNRICASLREIDESLESGEFRVRTELSLEAGQFDVEKFHETGNGSVASNRSMTFYSLPGIEVRGDIIFKARKIQKEQRFIGSPPMPEIETKVLSFSRREITYRPRPKAGSNLLSFVVRIDDNVRLEEVAYWCPSILDLFGLWGAMASFIATLSIGFLATNYNRWRFHRHFRKMANVKRREAQVITEASMEWMRKKKDGDDETATSSDGGSRMLVANSRRRKEIYQNLQEQYDALLVEPDIRLFESHHFDQQGHVSMSAAELKFPSTAFGELRRLAILEHGKKKRAAMFLSLWYGRLLVKRGFIKHSERRRELFSPMQGTSSALMTEPNLLEVIRSTLSRLRHRNGPKSAENVISPSFQHLHCRESDWASRDIETGRFECSDDGDAGNEESHTSRSSVCTSERSRVNDVKAQQLHAVEVIAQLDPLTNTS